MQNFFVNKRMLIYGPAGTGKTLLAMEQCRRLNAEGRSVAYICYNKLIAMSVKNKFVQEGKMHIDVYTLPQLLMKLCGVAYPEDEVYPDQYFKEELPELFMKWSSVYISESERYDVVIVDEGQDIMNTYYMLCLNEIVKNGIDKGRWAIYYDKNQNIFGKYQELQDICDELEEKATCYPLSVNCRNTKQIATGNWYTTNISQAQIMKAEGEKVEYHPYETVIEERKELFYIIRRLRAEGISKNDIVILSPYLPTNKKSCLFEAKIPQDVGEIRFNEKRDLLSNSFIKAYTVQAYKGLEAKVILYIDILGFASDDDRLLNYVAISRARTYLELFYDKALENERQMMLLNTLKLE